MVLLHYEQKELHLFYDAYVDIFLLKRRCKVKISEKVSMRNIIDACKLNIAKTNTYTIFIYFVHTDFSL